MPLSGWIRNRRHRLAERALERQLQYQRERATTSADRDVSVPKAMAEHSRIVREKLSKFVLIGEDARVLEVGSGSEGLIFFFGCKNGIGVDPLADEYAKLLPWHRGTKTLRAFGENLPFEDAAFDVVLCDNVIDHAEDPPQIVEELVRVLRPGGVLYFTVNVHHPFWHVAATAHGIWRAIGIPIEISPFADHTVHLTPLRARALFEPFPLKIVSVCDTVSETKRSDRRTPIRHIGDLPKKIFYKNANLEVIAVRSKTGCADELQLRPGGRPGEGQLNNRQTQLHQ